MVGVAWEALQQLGLPARARLVAEEAAAHVVVDADDLQATRAEHARRLSADQPARTRDDRDCHPDPTQLRPRVMSQFGGASYGLWDGYAAARSWRARGDAGTISRPGPLRVPVCPPRRPAMASSFACAAAWCRAADPAGCDGRHV